VLRPLRLAAIVEAATYLVLLAAVADHRLLGERDLIRPAGLLHGVVFLVYLALVLAVRRERRWSTPEVVTLLAAAFVPLGTVVAERRLAAIDRVAPSG
jgi:integral membrane protein